MGRKRSQTLTFKAKKLKRLRKRTQKEPDFNRYDVDGWQKSKEDPTALVDVFKTLKLKPGITLRAYQFVEGLNGNALLYATPVDAPFPEPHELPIPPAHLWDRPEPPGALEDFMNAIEGDDTPWSYVEATLLARELDEFGAMWHGCSWSTHEIVGNEIVEEVLTEPKFTRLWSMLSHGAANTLPGWCDDPAGSGFAAFLFLDRSVVTFKLVEKCFEEPLELRPVSRAYT